VLGSVSRPRRLDGFAYVGFARYFLTTCTYQRHPTFRDAEIATRTIEHFRTTARAEQFELLAYCLMPDHAHLLVEGLTESADFRRFTKLAKQRSGAAYALTADRPLWQKGYYERVLRQEEDAREIARYIVANPVRAGIVESPDRYPHSGSDKWSIGELIEWVTRA
jgi:putative transposase